MKTYRAFNLYIHSELPLPELLEAEGRPDVTIRFGRLGEVREQHDGGNTYRGHVEGTGNFLISEGRDIIIEPFSGAEEGLLRTILLGPIFCILLRQRGLLVLHASCVDVYGKGIAFLGGSGWGKSTLAAAFRTQGHGVLTDDVMPIDLSGSVPIVYPSYPHGKLWPEAVTSLGHDAQSLSPVFQNSVKLSYKFAEGFRQSPLRLQRIYVLSKGEEHSITPLHAQEAFVELVRHTRAMSLITETSFMASHLKLCTELIRTIRFCRFTRRPALEDLPKLVSLIEQDLDQMVDFRSQEFEASRTLNSIS